MSEFIRFYYTKTGAQSPDELEIQIFTVEGKLLRRFSKEEIGSLRAGGHLTELEWDGRDANGNRLPGGIYLYRTIAKDDYGNVWPKAESEFDEYLNEGVGKLIIQR